MIRTMLVWKKSRHRGGSASHPTGRGPRDDVLRYDKYRTIFNGIFGTGRQAWYN
jgi:hypothetical protein